MAEFIYNSYHYPMNNGDNVWELELRVGEIGENFGSRCFGWGEIGENVKNWCFGWGNREKY